MLLKAVTNKTQPWVLRVFVQYSCDARMKEKPGSFSELSLKESLQEEPCITLWLLKAWCDNQWFMGENDDRTFFSIQSSNGLTLFPGNVITGCTAKCFQYWDWFLAPSPSGEGWFVSMLLRVSSDCLHQHCVVHGPGSLLGPMWFPCDLKS